MVYYLPKSGVWIFSFSKSPMVAVEGLLVLQPEGVISSAILNTEPVVRDVTGTKKLGEPMSELDCERQTDFFGPGLLTDPVFL